jgi:conjugative transposon TraM protein
MQIERLEHLLTAFQNRDTVTNPQLQQVSQVLDKILTIQHGEKKPGIAADSIPDKPALAVSNQPTQPEPDFPAQAVVPANGFFGANDDPDSGLPAQPPLLAVVHGDQAVVTGAKVKLRLLQDIFVGGERIPANSFIYGPASISGDRVLIQLSSVSVKGRLLPVSLKVYDATDGLEGLYVPGLISRDVLKENMSQSVSGVNIGSLDPSLGAQAAAAGIETARNLLSRKIRLVKATLKEGHIVILRSMNQFK